MASCSAKRRSGKQELLKRLSVIFNTLKQRDKKDHYSNDDDTCKEAAREIFQILQELTESKSETVLKFKVLGREEHQELNDQIEDLKKKLKTEERRKEDSVREERRIHSEEIQSFKTELEKLNCAKKDVENENKRLSTKGEENNKKIIKLEAELRELGEAREKLEDEKKSIKETAELQNEGNTKEINRLKFQIETLEDARKHLDEEIEGLQKAAKLQQEIDAKEIGRLESEIKKLEDLNTRNEEKLETIRKQLEDKENNERKLSRNLRYSEDKVNQQGAQIQALVYENNQVKSHLEMQRNSIDKLQKSLSEEKKAKEHALNRLSAAAAHRLRDQNPGITDLSDPNRPLKLAEKVSELYDNEWTNAMENLEKLDIQEEKGIRILLKIIKNVFDTCMVFGDSHLESFPDLLVLPPVIFELQKERVLSVKGMSSEMLKPMKDYRKSNAEHAISRLQEYIATEKKSKLHIKQKIYDSCKEYIEKCVELCWMMRIQDPPIYMEADYKTNSAFDSNKMRSYTKAGKFVHFVVWPTFFLHRDGPLLAKGVVQGSKLEIAEEESSHLSDDGTDDEFLDALPFNDNKSDDVTHGSQSNQGNADKLINDTNEAPIDAERLENEGKEGKGEDDSSPDVKQSNQRNGELSNDKSNTSIETNCSETNGKGENKDVSQITESNPEKNKLPNDNSNASIGSKCSDDDGNGEGDDVPDGKKSDLDNGMQSNTSFLTECSENEDISRNSDEKAGSEKATDNPLFTNDQEIDF